VISALPTAAFVRRSVFVEEAAVLLGVSRRTVYYRIREGRLRTIRTRCGSCRILVESIDALILERAAKQAARLARSQAKALALQVQPLP
jgi:excisionase family DNA binding protein